MSKLIDMSIADFVRQLASAEPVPGGGGAAAVAGALAAALGSMAGSLSCKRLKDDGARAELNALLEGAEELSSRLLAEVDRDAEAFLPLAEAYKLPKDAIGRQEIMENATMTALQPPLCIMRLVCDIIELLEKMLLRSSKLLLSDVGCGAYLGASALQAASLNVFINTKYLMNRVEAERLEAEVDEMLKEYLPRASQVGIAVQNEIRGK